jgi:hypothetical protein
MNFCPFIHTHRKYLPKAPYQELRAEGKCKVCPASAQVGGERKEQTVNIPVMSTGMQEGKRHPIESWRVGKPSC